MTKTSGQAVISVQEEIARQHKSQTNPLINVRFFIWIYSFFFISVQKMSTVMRRNQEICLILSVSAFNLQGKPEQKLDKV